MKIAKIVIRHYRDSGQNVSIVEWANGSTTQGAAYLYNGLLLPEGTHMGALFDRGLREGLTVERQAW